MRRGSRAGLVLAALAILLGLVGSVGSTPAPASADTIRDREYWLDDYGIRAAWAATRGAGVTIAVIDTGVDATHPDLREAVVGGADFSGAGAPNGERPVGSDSEHGTLVASLAAGRGSGEGGGVLGAAPAASILSISVGFGSDAVDSDDQIASAVRWAVDHGAEVINMSLTRNTPDWPASWDSAFLYAFDHDVVVVAAAGNRASGTAEVGAPATMPGVLTVAGVTRSGQASEEASSQGITIGVAAPSEELVGDLPGDRYASWSGTSGAAPIVSGIVALVRAAHPDLDADDVIERVVATARDAGPPGPDVTYGHGLVDARAAVTAAVPHVTANPMGDLRDWIRLHRRAPATAPPLLTTPSTPAPAPVATPAPEAGRSVLDGLYPTWAQARELVLPVFVVVVFAAGFLLVLLLGARRVLGARKNR